MGTTGQFLWLLRSTLGPCGHELFYGWYAGGVLAGVGFVDHVGAE